MNSLKLLQYFFAIIICNPLSLLSQIDKKAEIIFSHKHGFYYAPFELTVSVNVIGAKIRYALNGINPFKNSDVYQTDNPSVIRIDPSDISNRDTAPGFIITVCATFNDTLISDIVTQTYIFPDKIVELSPHNQIPGNGWLDFNAPHYITYGLAPDIYLNPQYSSKIKEAFLSIPTISLVTDLRNLFDPDSGIYANPSMHGKEWEREASLELINPSGDLGFQINCGIRIRGGWSREIDNPKHAFRVFFDNNYGASKLKFPLFENEGTDEFKKLDIRTAQNYSWSFMGDSRNTFLRDIFSRDTQRDMNQPYTRSRYYHLYINGTYWGLYQTQERSDANFAASYFGGSKNDYDVIKVDIENNYTIEATDGTLIKWRELWEKAQVGFASDESYFKVQGLNLDGTRNLNYEKLLDIDNLIDYMIITFFTGDFDGPVSNFLNNTKPNNFYAIYNKVNPDGFKFFRHDAEHTLLSEKWGFDRTGPYTAGQYFEDSNPQWIHQKLSENSNYRLHFGDRVYKHFFNNGVLTLEKNIKRLNERKKQIDLAIIAESARWGDAKTSTSFSKSDWLNAVNFIISSYLPSRNQYVLAQLKTKDLFKFINPPKFNLHGGIVNKGFNVELRADNGIIYYTIDGTDPSLPASMIYTEPITINQTLNIKTRLLIEGEWSNLNEAQFIIDEDMSALKITELHYHPLNEIVGQDTISDKEYEFLELKNISSKSLNLSSSKFIKGISYTFPINSVIEAGEFLVLASNSDEFYRRYGFYPYAEYEGQLDNSGEKIIYVNAAGDTVLAFSYNDRSPWPEEADGLGYSLVSKRRTPIDNPNNSEYWIMSYEIHGSPEKDDLISDTKTINGDKYFFELNQNYPNPFNSTTIIEYSIPEITISKRSSQKVTLKVYDILGREIATLINKNHSIGKYKINFDAEALTSGLYIYQLKVGNYIQAKKMLILK